MTKQVGGDHYAADDQIGHWDLMEDYNVSYLIGNATKYICRHHRKNGKQDILKAISYLEKAKQKKLNRASPAMCMEDLEHLLKISKLSCSVIERATLILLLREERDVDFRWLDLAIDHCKNIVSVYELQSPETGREKAVAQAIVDNEQKLGLDELQRQIGEWSQQNFEGNVSHVTGQSLYEIPSLLGVGEEVGEIISAVVKSHQGRFKGTPEEAEMKIKDGTADLMIFLCDFATRQGFSILEVLNNVWATVQKRSQASWVEDKEKEDLRETVEGKNA